MELNVFRYFCSLLRAKKNSWRDDFHSWNFGCSKTGSRSAFFGEPLSWQELGLSNHCVACRTGKDAATGLPSLCRPHCLGFGVRARLVPDEVTFISAVTRRHRILRNRKYHKRDRGAILLGLILWDRTRSHDPSKIEIKTHMFLEEGMHWVGFNKDDTSYSKHRINADGSAAIPIDR